MRLRNESGTSSHTNKSTRNGRLLSSNASRRSPTRRCCFGVANTTKSRSDCGREVHFVREPYTHAGVPGKEVQRILAEVHGVSERQRRWPRRVRIVSVEAVAEKWLVPRLATFTAAHPGVALELETNHRGVDPDRRDFDAWLAYTGETAAPRPVTSREDTLLEETLYEEQLLPVCSPVLLAARGRTWRGPRASASTACWSRPR